MKTGRVIALAVLLAVVAVDSVSFQSSTANSPEEFPPHWVQADWELRTRGGGNWMFDNSAFKTEAEPFDGYGMEWTWGLGKKSVKGRLYVIQQGQDKGTLFEYRVAWHPGEKKLLLTQYGSDGTLGAGTVTSMGENRTEALQRFYSPDGSTFQVGHRVELSGDEMRMQSFMVSEGGVWTERKRYLWKRVNHAAPKATP